MNKVSKFVSLQYKDIDYSTHLLLPDTTTLAGSLINTTVQVCKWLLMTKAFRGVNNLLVGVCVPYFSGTCSLRLCF